MNRKFLIVAMSAALLLGSMQAEQGRTSAPPPTNWKQVPIPPLPAFKPKEPKRVVLPNGMILMLTEDHELPLISGNAMVRGGSDSEPADKTGLVELYGNVWRTGGTEQRTGDQLDDLLEARAAKVETAGGDESTTISFNCLKGDFADVLPIFAELLRHPAFRQDKLTLAQKQMFSEISRRNDETDEIASIQTDILGYGKDSAYARIPEYATVRAVSRQDLIDWHARHAAPNNIILGVVGDFDSQQMEQQLRAAFGDWPSGEKMPEPKVAIDPARPGIYLVDKSDVNQSAIRMIDLGIERRDPDYFAVQVMDEVFGGGFSSRLFMNLRTKAGLAYAVGGGVGSGWDHPGLTILEIGTKTETTVDAIKGLWEQIELMKSTQPTETEVKRAKDQILNSFIFNFDTPAKVLREQETYEFYGYPSDFLERYRAGVEKVTPADVLRVANKYLHKDKMKILVVGNAGEFEKQLATLGPVSPIDITIPTPEASNAGTAHLQLAMAQNAEPPTANEPASPGPQAAPQASSAGGNAEGVAAINKLIEFVGGQAKVAGVKTVHQRLVATQAGVETSIDQSTIYPDKQVLLVVYDRGVVRQVLTPDISFLYMGSSKQPLTTEQRDTMESELKCELLNVLQHAHDPNYTFTAHGTEKVGIIDAMVVDINANGAKTRWWISPDGALLQDERSATAEGVTKSYRTRYGHWRNFDGLKYPAKQSMFIGGEEQGVSVTKAMEFNAPIDPTLFQ